jgi:hypothetical protein
MSKSYSSIQDMRLKSLQASIESIAVFILAIFVSALLPSLLFRYMFANQQLLEQPKIFEYIPVVSFALGIGYFIYAMAGNLMREMSIKKTLSDMEMMGCDCDGCDCHGMDDHHHEMMPVSASNDALAKKLSKAKKSSKK